MVISKTELRARGSYMKCLVCHHPDKGMIESLLAAGVFYSDLAEEFGLQERSLRRHDALHSTKQPSVDPLSILRNIRWLNEQSTLLTQNLLRSGAGQKRSKEIYRLRMEAIRTSLAVTTEYAKLTDAKKHIDPHVTLPRWKEVIGKLGEALRTIPEAEAALLKLEKEEGPGRREDKDSNTTEARFGPVRAGND
jgi:hypothetical protein